MRTWWPWRFGNDLELSTFPGIGVGLSAELVDTNQHHRWHIQTVLVLPFLMFAWDLRIWRKARED